MPDPGDRPPAPMEVRVLQSNLPPAVLEVRVDLGLLSMRKPPAVAPPSCVSATFPASGLRLPDPQQG